MKIAAKVCLTALIGLGAGASPVFAQDLASAALGVASAGQEQAQAQTQGQQVQTQAQAVLPSSSEGSGEASAMPHIAAPEVALANAPASLGGKPEELAAPKTPDSVKSVIKRLNTATDGVSLDDLNSAREAVAKLDMLIDIEKRLTDLEKIRQEREGQSLSSAIPASALGMGGSFAPGMQPYPGQPANAGMPVAAPVEQKVEVVRIQGARGRFAAVVKTGEDKREQVRAGDTLADGSEVLSVSSRGVVLLKDQKKRTLNVKDVDAVFGGR